MQALSLKQQRTAAKQAKQIKELERKAKSHNKKVPQFHKYTNMHLHHINRKRLVLHARDHNGTCFTEAEIAQQRQSMQSLLDDLIYYRNMGETITRIEMTVITAQVMTGLLASVSTPCANDLNDTVNKALEEMKLAQVYDMSPSQRRAAFKDLECVFDLMCIWLQLFSKEVIATIKSITIATQVCHYFKKLYVHVYETVALIDVIKGENSRKMAAQQGLKESELKLKLFTAAKWLYRIAWTQDECVASDLYYPSSIPDLRQKAFQHLADFDFLSKLSSENLNKIIKPFQREYDIDLLGIKKYEITIAQAAKQNLLAA